MFTQADYNSLIGSKIQQYFDNEQIVCEDRNIVNKYPCFKRGLLCISNISSLIPVSPEDFYYCGREIISGLSFVQWVEGRISCFQMPSNGIAVSFPFTGCYMSKFEYENKLYIAHIQSGNSSRIDAWNEFVSSNVDKVSVKGLFRPTNLEDDIYRKQQRLLHEHNERKRVCTVGGVILPNNECYSVLVDVKTHKALDIFDVRSLGDYIPLLSC